MTFLFSHVFMHKYKKQMTHCETGHKPQSGHTVKQQLYEKEENQQPGQPPEVTSSLWPLLHLRFNQFFSYPTSHKHRKYNLKCKTWCLKMMPTSLEGPSLHPEFGKRGPRVVKRRVRHRSSAMGRPAGTGACSHWSSGTQWEEEAGWKEREGRRGVMEGG